MMDMSPQLLAPKRTRADFEAECTYFVKAMYGGQQVWFETPDKHSRETVIQDIAGNQLDAAIEVHFLHGRLLDDISYIIAQEALAAYIDGDDGSVENIPSFCTLHIPDAAEQVIQDRQREQAHIVSEKHAGAM